VVEKNTTNELLVHLGQQFSFIVINRFCYFATRLSIQELQFLIPLIPNT